MAGSISPARARVMRMLDIAAFSNLPGRQGEAVPYSARRFQSTSTWSSQHPICGRPPPSLSMTVVAPSGLEEEHVGFSCVGLSSPQGNFLDSHSHSGGSRRATWVIRKVTNPWESNGSYFTATVRFGWLVRPAEVTRTAAFPGGTPGGITQLI